MTRGMISSTSTCTCTCTCTTHAHTHMISRLPLPVPAPAPHTHTHDRMQVVHASGACKWCVQVVHASGACKWCVQVVRASGACGSESHRLWCMHGVTLCQTAYICMPPTQCMCTRCASLCVSPTSYGGSHSYMHMYGWPAAMTGRR